MRAVLWFLASNSSFVQSGWTEPDWGSMIASGGAHGLYGPPLAVWHRWQSKIERGMQYLAACIFDPRSSLGITMLLLFIQKFYFILLMERFLKQPARFYCQGEIQMLIGSSTRGSICMRCLPMIGFVAAGLLLLLLCTAQADDGGDIQVLTIADYIGD